MPDNEFRLKRLEDRMEKAEDVAYTALNNGVSHEKVCAERYEQLQKTLDDMQKTLKNLVGGAHESKGMWKAIGLYSLITGILYTILRLSGHA